MAKPPKDLPTGIDWHVVRHQGEPKGGYRVRVRYGRKQISLGRYQNLQDAKAMLHDALQRIRDGRFIPPNEIHRRAILEQDQQDQQRLTVGEYAETWLDALANGLEPRTPATIASYRSTLNAHILPAFGSRWMIDVTQSGVDALLRKVQRESGPGASRNVARTLRALYRHAVDNKAGGMIKPPFSVTVKKSKLRHTDEVPSVAEVTRISAEMPPELELAPILSAVCALRPGETLGAQRGDLIGLDTSRPVLRVRRQWNTKTSPPSYTDPKAGSDRDVIIPLFLVPMIERHLASFVGPEQEAPLFQSPKLRMRPLGANTYRRRWNNAIEAAGVQPYVLHSLRHLGLTLLAIAGATQKELMARAGHSDVEAAARYQHAMDDRALELAAALGDQWEGGQ